MKNILITGASGGIGSEIARTFAPLGYRLFLIYNNNEKEIKKLEKELSTITEIVVYKCDLTNSQELSNMVGSIIDKFASIDYLINCAGVSLIKQIQDTTDADYSRLLDTNLKSTIMTTALVSKYMISEKFGRIVNISSMWGVVGASMESLYSASKGAINSFTLSLAKELGFSGITVNAVCPGLIDTKMNANINKSDLQDIIDNTPLQRIGTPKDIANIVEFLCSDRADFITGQIITVDGGFSL
ncbi:MAG: elongation factor P 5-aminopentanone reductase [Clostridia bacterium]